MARLRNGPWAVAGAGLAETAAVSTPYAGPGLADLFQKLPWQLLPSFGHRRHLFGRAVATERLTWLAVKLQKGVSVGALATRCMRTTAPVIAAVGTTALLGRGLHRRCQCTASAAARWPGALPSATPPALRAALEDDDRGLCALPIDPQCVSTLSCPTEFYERLLSGTATAQRRILLASLYIGTGSKEEALLDAVSAACTARPDLKATLLVDALRTQRVERSGVSSLDKIVEICGSHLPQARSPGGTASALPAAQLERDSGSRGDGGGGLSVFMYHTHLLGKLGKRVLPPRWNEGISLQHCKVYLFDDTVILSGANLSDTYFTDRDDRCVVFTDCAPLADYVYELFASEERGLPAACYSVSKPSSLLENSAGTSPDDSNCEICAPAIGHDPVEDASGFETATAAHLQRFLAEKRSDTLQQLRDWKHQNEESERTGRCTWVVPTLQMAAHKITQDEPLLAEVVSQLGEGNGREPAAASSDSTSVGGGHGGRRGTLVLSSAYLNLTSSQTSFSPLADALKTSGADIKLVLASDESHGFSGASGLSAYIPRGYALLRSRLQRYLESERAREPSAEQAEQEQEQDGDGNAMGMDGGGRGTEVWLHRRLVDGKHWSFHCKALWYTSPGATAGPGLTVVGSSNFGRRSMVRDLEAQFWVVTDDQELQGRLQSEQDMIMSHAVGPVAAEKEEAYDWKVKLLTFSFLRFL